MSRAHSSTDLVRALPNGKLVEFLAIVPKGKNAELRVEIGRKGGRRTLDIRTWFRPPQIKDAEPMIPTRRGVEFGMEKVPEIAAAFLRAVEQVKAEESDAS